MARRDRDPEAFRVAVEAVVAALAPGEVVSYGDVAVEAGYPGAARGVGAVMRTCSPGLPWWRVVASDGRLVTPSAVEQERRLRAEGVTVERGHVRGGARPR